MRNIFTLWLLVSVLIGCDQAVIAPKTEQAGTIQSQDSIREAFLRRQSNIIVSSSATVVKVLSDDINPPRHQRFIARIPNGMTVLISHNIDLAPRVNNIQAGDEIIFQGEYEYNEKGGVIHWTHHDPRGTHIPGWIKHQGKTYQ